MSHLTSDELVDAVDARLDPARTAHLRTCEHCRRELASLTAVLREVRDVEVPEPSPFFWAAFSSRVREAVAATPSRIARWFDWPVFAPVAGLALLVLALVWAVPTRTPDTFIVQGNGTAPASETPAPIDSWELMAALVAEIDLEAAAQSGFAASPGAADVAAAALSSDERQELVRLLRAELEQSGG